MTTETKTKILTILFIIFYPFAGLYMTCKDCEGRRFDSFMDDWGYYLLFTFFWILGMGTISLIVYGFMYHFIETIIPVGIIGGIIFFIVGLPYIIYKIANRK